MERLASLNTTFIMILEKEKQLHVSVLRPSSGWILGLKEKYFNSTCYQTTPTVQLHHTGFSIRSTTRLHNLDVHSEFPRITTEEKTPQNPSEVQEHTWTSPHVPASQRTLMTPCGTANHPHIGSNKHTPHPTCSNTPRYYCKTRSRFHPHLPS
jgi:hypothetical protein